MAFLGQMTVKRPGWMLATLLVLACALIYVIWIGIDPVVRRYELLAQGSLIERSELRLILWRAALPLIRIYPVFGTGLGTFEIAYRRYQDIFTEQIVNDVHNDYLEFASDLGLVGVVLLFAPIFSLGVKMVRTFVTTRGRYRRAVLLGCIGSVFAMLMHTAVDFNLQIPANALTFAVILGIGYKTASTDPGRARARVQENFHTKRTLNSFGVA